MVAKCSCAGGELDGSDSSPLYRVNRSQKVGRKGSVIYRIFVFFCNVYWSKYICLKYLKHLLQCTIANMFNRSIWIVNLHFCNAKAKKHVKNWHNGNCNLTKFNINVPIIYVFYESIHCSLKVWKVSCLTYIFKNSATTPNH